MSLKPFKMFHFRSEGGGAAADLSSCLLQVNSGAEAEPPICAHRLTGGNLKGAHTAKVPMTVTAKGPFAAMFTAKGPWGSE